MKHKTCCMHCLHRLCLFLKWAPLDLYVTSLVMCIYSQESLIAHRARYTELFTTVVSVISKLGEYIVHFFSSLTCMKITQCSFRNFTENLPTWEF